MHFTEESDCHWVFSHAVPPILAFGVKSIQPKFAPKIVLITPPNSGPFGYVIVVPFGTSKVKSLVMVATPSPTVVAKGFGYGKPLGVLQTVEDVDFHIVASQPVPPPICVA